MAFHCCREPATGVIADLLTGYNNCNILYSRYGGPRAQPVQAFPRVHLDFDLSGPTGVAHRVVTGRQHVPVAAHKVGGLLHGTLQDPFCWKK